MALTSSIPYPNQKSMGLLKEFPEIKVRIVFNKNLFITYINQNITFDLILEEIQEICNFSIDDLFTIKWLDEEGDPCTINSQFELSEALRLYEINNETELTIHVFPGIPSAPGKPCPGEEDLNIYRRGARRWRKSYRINGHNLQVKREYFKNICWPYILKQIFYSVVSNSRVGHYMKNYCLFNNIIFF